MEIKFRNAFSMSPKTIREAAFDTAKKWRVVLVGVFVLIALVCGLALLFGLSAENHQIVRGLFVFFLFGAGVVIVQFFAANSAVYKQSRNNPDDTLERIIDFSDKIVFSSPSTKQEISFSYSKVMRITHTKRAYYLWFSEKQCIGVRCGCFIYGNEAQFLPFITKKCKKATVQ